MRLGIDIDLTITNSTVVIRKYMRKYGYLYCDNNEEDIIRSHLKMIYQESLLVINQLKLVIIIIKKHKKT